MRKLSLVLAACTAAVLVMMVITSLVMGASQERFEHFNVPEQYALALLHDAKGLRVLMGLDVAFCCLYTAYFAAFSKYLRALGRPFATIAFGAMLATAVLDFIEDHHILSMLDSAEHGVLPSAIAIRLQAVESSVKFSMSFMSLVFYGLAIPRTTKLGLALALFLTVGTLLSGAIGFAAPPEFQAHLDHGRWVGFLVGFALAMWWLRSAPEPAVRSTMTA